MAKFLIGDKMGITKVLLVGVCEYLTMNCSSLLMCKNGLYTMRTALVNGLNVNPKIKQLTDYPRKTPHFTAFLTD